VVGTSVMMDMMLTGRLLDVHEGLATHIVRYVTPPGQALAKARSLAARIAQNTLDTNWKIINVLPRIQDMSHDDGLFVEQMNSAMARGPEAAERLKAFVEKRAEPLGVAAGQAPTGAAGSGPDTAR